MKVTVHGPNLRDQSNGTFRVHASESPDSVWEVEENDSQDPSEIDAESCEDVIDFLYPKEEFDRVPEDLDVYLADTHFGESLAELPVTAQGDAPTRERVAPERRATGGIAAVNATDTEATCRYCTETKPLTAEHWYQKSAKKGGGFYIEGRCKKCEHTRRAARKASPSEPATAPETTPEPTQETDAVPATA